MTPVDHWIAFVLLGGIGGKMLWDAFHEEKDDGEGCGCDKANDRLDLRELTLLAVATSIDALAVGITFAFLQVDIVPAVLTIGITTFVLSLVGVIVGNQFGSRFERPATIAGGVVLIPAGSQDLAGAPGDLGVDQLRWVRSGEAARSAGFDRSL